MIQRSSIRRIVSFIGLFGILNTLFAPVAWSDPKGPTVVAGSATVTKTVNASGGTDTTVNAASRGLLMNWSSIGTGANEAWQFVQPDALSVAVNRDLGGLPSVLAGRLLANGSVWILNPYGVVFNNTSQVNVYGVLASTLNIADQDFINGRYLLTQDPSKALGAVVNQGNIQAASAAFVSPLAYNTGTIAVNSGNINLSGRSRAVISLDAAGLINVTNPGGPPSPGPVLMRQSEFDSVLQSVVNNPNIIANGSFLPNPDGTVFINGVTGLSVNSGTLSANGGSATVPSVKMDSNQATVLTAGSSISAVSSGGLPGGTIDLEADQKIWAQRASIVSNAMLGSIRIATPGSVSIDRSTVSVQNGGGLTALSGGDMNLSNSTFQVLNGNNSVNNDLRLSADGVLTMDAVNAIGDHNNNVTIFGNSGLNIVDGSRVIQTTGGDLKILSEGQLNIIDSRIEASNHGKAVISTDQNLFINRSVVNRAFGDDLVVHADNNLTSQNSTFSDLETNNVIFSAGNNLELDSSKIIGSFVGDTSISAGNNVSLSQLVLQNDHSGNITIGAGGNLAATGLNLTQSQGKDVTLRSAGTINLAGSVIGLDHSGDLAILATRDMIVSGSRITNSFGNNTRLSSDGSLTLSSTSVFGDHNGDTTLFGDLGLVMDNSRAIASFAGNLQILSEGDLSIKNNSQVFADHNGRIFVSADGNVNISDSSFDHESGADTVVNAKGDLTVTNSQFTNNFVNGVSLLSGGNFNSSGLRMINDSVEDTHLQAGKSFTADNLSLKVSNSRDVVFGADNGNLSMTNSNVTVNSSNDLDIFGSQNIGLVNDTISANQSRDFTVETEQSLWINNSTLNQNGGRNFSLIANHGNLGITDSQIHASHGSSDASFLISAPSTSLNPYYGNVDVTRSNITDTNGGVFQIQAGNQFDAEDSQIVQTNGGNFGIRVGKGYGIGLNNSSITSKNSGDLFIEDQGLFWMGASTINQTGGGKFVLSAGIDPRDGVTGIVMVNGSKIRSSDSGNFSIATAGRFGMDNSSIEDAGLGSVTETISAGGAFTMDNNAVISKTSPGDLSITGSSTAVRSGSKVTNTGGSTTITPPPDDPPASTSSRPSSIQDAVTLLYSQLLHRQPDPGGMTYWTGVIQGVLSKGGTMAQAIAQVTSGIEASQEFRQDVITQLYVQLLHRQPDPGGLAFWVNTMGNMLAKGLTVDQAVANITAGFESSAEYRKLHP